MVNDPTRGSGQVGSESYKNIRVGSGREVTEEVRNKMVWRFV